jgi:hypothetical protein
MYVQHQLGHSDIKTTEGYYGHLERHVLAQGARNTEIAPSRKPPSELALGSRRPDDYFVT